MNTEQVIIDDDNDSRESVIILDEDAVLESKNKNSANVIDTINFDDESVPSGTSDNNKNAGSFPNLLRNNILMSKLVKKCLTVNKSGDITRVIYKTVLPIYKDTDRSFKESANLRRAIKATLRLLEVDPNHMFSHIKSLCVLLQSKKKKRKVPFITLCSGLPLLPANNMSRVYNENNVTRTNRKIEKAEVIDLVNTDKDSIIIVDCNEGNNDVIILDEQTSIISQTPKSDNSNKENNKKNIIEKTSDKDLIQDTDKGSPNTSVENNLLMPHDCEDFSDETIVTKKVEMIEAEIKVHKNLIAMLEEQEVTNDSHGSQYLQSDKMKKKIVKLYEELCTLTGEEAVKHRQVRLQVTLGHPPGPVKKLEEYLNRNIDSTGAPPFPDFNDVINCVQRANIEDGLWWTKAQVTNEALALFTQCGHALRKSRQKREWRDLMSLVKQEQPDGDPADEDPVLSARLEENKRLAQEKEHEILERYAQMEHQPTLSTILNPRLGNTEIQDAYETSDAESEFDNFNVGSSSGVNNGEIRGNNVVDTVPSNMNIAEASNVLSELPVQIKQEPVDVQSMLDGLGSDYTVTVFDIEDPFLVIEISSDSSCSDDEL